MKGKAVVLLSGGLDSTTTLAIARAAGFEAYALTVFYGQKNRLELERAALIAKHFAVCEQRVLQIDLSVFGGSSLTTEATIERHRHREEIGSNIPSTYVPARNTILLSLALAWADSLRARDIFIGVNAIDSSGYPDCRPEFIHAFSHLAQLATRTGIEDGAPFQIHTPLATLSKSEIIRRGLELGVDYSLTITCYEPTAEGLSCGVCDSCTLRQLGFQELGLVDPLPYARLGRRANAA